MRYLFLTFCLTLNLGSLSSQSFNASQDPRQFIDSAIVFMNQEKYQEADQYFLKALDKIEVLSADFCYHFGKNSFFLQKYRQSIDWLNKYLELKGSKGQFSKEVFVLVEKAEGGFRENKDQKSGEKAETRFFYKNTIDCETGSMVTCPVCKGDDVIVTLDKLGERRYRTCPYSTQGRLSCEDFNLLVQGQLKPKKDR